MLKHLLARAEKEGLNVAPFLGVGCPGLIKPDGSIARGGQNLPGNWESSRFNLPQQLREMMPTIGAHETLVVMHNDAVVQGLSETPFMRDFAHWGVLTIGTGLGNACFSRRKPDKEEDKPDKEEKKKK
jgi:predicted NBD/HSP70 family sugar kinase